MLPSQRYDISNVRVVHGWPAFKAWVKAAAQQPPVAPKNAMSGLFEAIVEATNGVFVTE